MSVCGGQRHQSLGVIVTGGCELHDMGVVNGPSVLCKRSASSPKMSHLSITNQGNLPKIFMVAYS